MARYRLKAPQASVLSFLGKEREAYFGELPRVVKLTPTEVREAVEDLESHGLVRISKHPTRHAPESREITMVQVTPKGLERVRLLTRGGDRFTEDQALTRVTDLDEEALDEKLSAALDSL